MTRTTTRAAAVAAAALTAVLLTGCGAGGGSDSTAGRAASGAVGGEASPGAPQSGKAAGAAGSGRDTSQAADVAVLEQRIVRNGDLVLQARDVPGVTARVHTIVDTADGFVADERTTSSSDPGAPVPSSGQESQQGQPGQGPPVITSSVLTVRVPNAALDRVMQQVGALGNVVSRSQTSEDVTTQYVDTASRVASQTASVARVRALLAQATNLGQIVQIEGELARREADLESLQAQLKALQDKTALSTLTITVTAPGVAPHQERSGFLGGLQAGWSALVTSLGLLLTVLGAVLPFALLLALLAWPLLWWLRRQRRRALPQPQPAP